MASDECAPGAREAASDGAKGGAAEPPSPQHTEWVVLKARKERANPAPLGLFAFGLTTALLQGATTKLTAHGAGVHLTSAFGLFYGGLVQLLCGAWEVSRNNIFGVTAFSSYGAFWMSLGVYNLLEAGGVVDTDEGAMQMMLSLWAVFTYILFVQTLRMNVALMVLFFSLGTLFALLAASQGTGRFHVFAGGWGIWTGAVAFYAGGAELTNEVYHRRVLPLGAVQELHWGNAIPGLGLPLTREGQASDLHGPGYESSSNSSSSQRGSRAVKRLGGSRGGVPAAPDSPV